MKSVFLDAFERSVCGINPFPFGLSFRDHAEEMGEVRGINPCFLLFDLESRGLEGNGSVELLENTGECLDRLHGLLRGHSFKRHGVLDPVSLQDLDRFVQDPLVPRTEAEKVALSLREQGEFELAAFLAQRRFEFFRRPVQHTGESYVVLIEDGLADSSQKFRVVVLILRV